MDLGLQKKVAVVVGSSRGIGRAIALALADEGCQVVLCARAEETLGRTAAEVEERGVRALAIPIDVTEEGAADRVIDGAVQQFGRVDVLVNNVGGNRRKPFIETTDEDWQTLVELNVMTHVRFARTVVPVMRKHTGGSIVFVSSLFGREAGGRGLVLYNTTKSAIISAAKILALELAPHGIRVNSVAPGSIRFPGGTWDRRCQEDPDGMQLFVEQNLPLGRFGTAEEVADVVAFLASRRAGLITGACLAVDGGQGRSLI